MARPDRSELPLVGGRFFGPEGAHQGQPVTAERAPGRPLHTVVGGLLDVPAVADAERETAAGEVVERGGLLRQVDGVVLGDQRDAGAEGQPLGDGGGLPEGHEGVECPAVLVRQLAARRVRGVPADGDVGVLGQVQPGESALLQLARDPDRRDRPVGEEDRCGDPHGGSSVVVRDGPRYAVRRAAGAVARSTTHCFRPQLPFPADREGEGPGERAGSPARRTATCGTAPRSPCRSPA